MFPHPMKFRNSMPAFWQKKRSQWDFVCASWNGGAFANMLLAASLEVRKITPKDGELIRGCIMGDESCSAELNLKELKKYFVWKRKVIVLFWFVHHLMCLRTAYLGKIHFLSVIII